MVCIPAGDEDPASNAGDEDAGADAGCEDAVPKITIGEKQLTDGATGSTSGATGATGSNSASASALVSSLTSSLIGLVKVRQKLTYIRTRDKWPP